MDLSASKTIGPYTIDREIGRGGMGVVYLGRDTRLDRAVAIKSLPEHFAAEPERMARFEREAKTLASLNHPNIAGIHGIEEADGAKYLILEYVDGETLADRLDRGALPVDDALEICAQIAAGVEAAHEAGVIHRDLKPANIKIDSEGCAKVLDFGLARMEESSSTGSSTSQLPTLTTPHSPTTPGAILGTAPYMSPEQARGRRVDKRSDIWSFGVVLYECLTGVSPFIGETATDSIGAILHKDIDLSLLPSKAPPIVHHVLRRCLERDKSQRYRDIGDVRLDLIGGGESNEGVGSAKSPGVRLLPVLVVMAVIAAAAAAVLIYSPVRFGTQPNAAQEIRFTISAREIARASGGDIDNARFQWVLISPDGSMLALQLMEPDSPIVIRDLASSELRALPDTAKADYATFSPDGQWIAFVQDGMLMRSPVSGGPPRTICALPGDRANEFLAWNDDDTIVWVPTDDQRLYRVNAQGKELEEFSVSDASRSLLGFDQICTIPGRTDVMMACMYTGSSIEDYVLVIVSLKDGSLRPVYNKLSNPHITTEGRLYAQLDSTIFTVPFDLESLEVTGELVPMIDSVATDEYGNEGVFDVSHNGDYFYASGRRSVSDRRIIRVDQQGAILGTVGERGDYAYNLSCSPVDDRFVVSTLTRSLEMWMFEPATGARTRLVSSNEAYDPIWSPDGRSLVYQKLESEGSGNSYSFGRVYIRELNRDTPPVALDLTNAIHAPSSWSPDGTVILLNTVKDLADPQADITIWNLESSTQSEYLATPAFESNPTFSPDGKWVLYRSDESGTNEIYLRAYPDNSLRYAVSRGYGDKPMWSPDGSAIYFVSNDGMKSVSFTADPAVQLGVPRILFSSETPVGRMLQLLNDNEISINANGEFLFLEPPAHLLGDSYINVVLNPSKEK